MPAGAITSDKVVTIEREVACRECGYNLRGLPSTGDCPECGHAVCLSITDSMDNFLRCLPDAARRNLRMEITFEPYGLWITGWPLLSCLGLIAAAALGGFRLRGAYGAIVGATAGIVAATFALRWLIARREKRAIARYLSRQCIDRRLNRCPLCYHDLSGAMADTCPECGCPVSVRTLAY